MIREILISKIHRATVTEANTDYIGSISIGKELMQAANINKNEKVHVWDVTNGNRLQTYAIEGKKGEICLNGAAAKLIKEGDIVIIACFGYLEEEKLNDHKPKLIFVDNKNNITETR